MKPRNTDIWKFVIASGRLIFKKRNPHRDLEILFGIATGRLREVVDRDDMPERVVAAIERILSLGAGAEFGRAHEAAIAAKDVMTAVRDQIAKRQDARMRHRLANDPSENALFRELIMERTGFYDSAERKAYSKWVEKEYA
jgi:hypothetical protein